MARDDKKDDFIKAPRSIVRAQDLTSTEKVLLLLLIDKYNAMKAFNRLQADGTFYITGKEMEECMDIKKRQILNKHIPALERKGFIIKTSRPEDKEGSLKTYCYFTLNTDKILNHKGNQKDAVVQAKRAAKCEKMRQVMEKQPAHDTTSTTEPQRPVWQTSTEPQRPIQQTATMKETEPQKPFDINDMFLPDFDEDAAATDIMRHPEMYDAEKQWADFQ